MTRATPPHGVFRPIASRSPEELEAEGRRFWTKFKLQFVGGIASMGIPGLFGHWSSNHDPAVLLIVGAVIAFPLGAFATMFGSENSGLDVRRTGRRLAAVPVGITSETKEGDLVAFEGTLADSAGGSLLSSLDGSPCVWTTTTVFALAPQRQRPSSIRSEHRDDRVLFTVDDGAGATITVDPAGGTLGNAEHPLCSSTRPTDAHSDRLEAYAANLGLPPTTETQWLEGYERSVRPGDRVFVVGVFRRGSLRDGPPTLSSGPRDMLVVTTQSRDAMIRGMIRTPVDTLLVAGVVLLAVACALTALSHVL